jgi:HD-like signal output (HDOD) protein/nitrogen-specific signal transduction histidine kinase
MTVKTGLSQKLLEQIQIAHLPSLPQAVLRLLQACEKEDVSFEELSAIINTDSGLSSQMLLVANSPVYRALNKFTTVESTLVRLGLDVIKTIALTTSARQFFSRFRGLSSASYRQFWHESLICANVARVLADLTSYHQPDEAYVSGLFHKVGKLVLGVSFPTEYKELSLKAEGDQALAVMEQEYFGNSHPEVGAWYIHQWHLESFMDDAVLYQLEPLEEVVDAHHLVRLVYLANLITHNPKDQAGIAEAAERLFGLTQGVVADVQSKAMGLVDEILDAQGIDLSVPPAPDDELFNKDLLSDALDETELKLVDKVQRNVLLDGVRQHMSRVGSVDALLISIEQSVKILFGVPRQMFFLLGPDGESLRGHSQVEGDTRANELILSMREGKSLVSSALHSRTLLDSITQAAESGLSVIDRQIIRLMGGEHLICLPMQNEGEHIGCLVLGVGERRLESLLEQEGLLMAFANEAGGLLSDIMSRRSHDQQIEAEYQARARQVIHEANNPLGILRNYLQVLAGKLEDDHPALNDLRIIGEEVDRVGGIIRRLADTPEEMQQGSVNINDLISDVLTVFQDSLFIPRDIKIRVQMDEELPPIVTRANALKQVIINLIKNAVEAMGEAGTLTVKTEDYVYLSDKEYIEISIADSGPGIPPHILAHLFEPVTSTKGKGHSGLGLSIVNNLIKEMEGLISCRSNHKSGTSFHIYLPRELETV